MNIIVEFRYDRWEVIRQYGYRESLIGFYNTKEEAEEAAGGYRGFDREDYIVFTLVMVGVMLLVFLHMVDPMLGSH